VRWRPTRDGLKLDWIDAILFAVVFVGGISIIVVLEGTTGESESYAEGVLLSVVGTFSLRRMIFGAPVLPEPRPGVIWRLLSVLGLFTVLGGAVVFAFSASSLMSANADPPDFVIQASEAQKTATDFSELRALINAPKNETEGQRAQRLAREEEEEAQRRVERVAKGAALREADWQDGRQRLKSRSYKSAALGLLLIILGAGCLRVRYPS